MFTSLITHLSTADVVPPYDPALPPGLSGPAALALAWISGALILAGVIFLIIAGIRVMSARRNGSGDEGLESVGKVLGGLVLGLLAAGIVGAIVVATAG